MTQSFPNDNLTVIDAVWNNYAAGVNEYTPTGNGLPFGQPPITLYTYSTINQQNLDSINFRNGKIVFQLAPEGRLAERMPHLRGLLPEMPAVTVDAETVARIRNGMAVNVPEYSDSQRVKIFSNATELLAIGRRVAGTLVQPEIVLG